MKLPTNGYKGGLFFLRGRETNLASWTFRSTKEKALLVDASLHACRRFAVLRSTVVPSTVRRDSLTLRIMHTSSRKINAMFEIYGFCTSHAAELHVVLFSIGL